MNIVLLGPPGVGKGTQAQRLSQALKIPRISSGEIFRSAALAETELGTLIREAIERGVYVADEITNQVVLARLEQPDARNGFILDGYPRTVFQAKALDVALATEKRVVDAVLFLTASESVLRQRLSGRRGREGRADDLPQIISTRLTLALQYTEPLVAYYSAQSRLVTIDAGAALVEVNAEVDRALGLTSRR